MARFATATELATFLGHPGFSPATRAEQVLDLASALIRRTCNGQVLEQVSGAQEEFDGEDDLYTIFLTQRPVTAVSSVTVDAVAFTAFEWSRIGTIVKTDDSAWSEGPIVVTYDHGYAAASDELIAVKSICLEASARAITKETADAGTFGEGFEEARGWAPHLFLTDEERDRLVDFGAVPVG